MSGGARATATASTRSFQPVNLAFSLPSRSEGVRELIATTAALRSLALAAHGIPDADATAGADTETCD